MNITKTLKKWDESKTVKKVNKYISIITTVLSIAIGVIYLILWNKDASKAVEVMPVILVYGIVIIFFKLDKIHSQIKKTNGGQK